MKKQELILIAQELERLNAVEHCLTEELLGSVYSARYIIESNGYMAGVRLTFEFWDEFVGSTVLMVDTEDRLLFDAIGSRNVSAPITPTLAAFFRDFAIDHIGFAEDSELRHSFPKEADRNSGLFL